MDYYIKTDKSYLGKIDADIDELLSECVKEIKGKLDEKPPIIVFGKPATQHRNIGFFSNESIGYHYAGQLAASKPASDQVEHGKRDHQKPIGDQRHARSRKAGSGGVEVGNRAGRAGYDHSGTGCQGRRFDQGPRCGERFLRLSWFSRAMLYLGE